MSYSPWGLKELDMTDYVTIVSRHQEPRQGLSTGEDSMGRSLPRKERARAVILKKMECRSD